MPVDDRYIFNPQLLEANARKQPGRTGPDDQDIKSFHETRFLEKHLPEVSSPRQRRR
jgi:hypothetical protein